MNEPIHASRSSAAKPLTPPEVADILRTVELRAGYIIGACKDTREMRLEAEEIKRLLGEAFKGLRDWWHGPHAEADELLEQLGAPGGHVAQGPEDLHGASADLRKEPRRGGQGHGGHGVKLNRRAGKQ